MKKLGDSLLARSAKVTDLMSKLENSAEEMPDGSMEKKRITRPGVETTNTEPQMSFSNLYPTISSDLSDPLGQGP